MLASEILGPARVLAKDPQPGTYSDAALCGQLDLVCLDIMDRVKFPFASISTPTIANQQIYVLPETPLDDGNMSVYLNGQLLTKTSRMTLQGQEIGYFDQRGQGTQAPGAAGPTYNAGMYTPLWLVQPPTVFPIANAQGSRPFAGPWGGYGYPPRYFLEGGNLVIVPAPSMSAPLDPFENPIPNLTIYMAISNAYLGPYTWNGTYTQPKTLTSGGDRIWFPNNFKNALVWNLVHRIAQADNTQMSEAAKQTASQEARDQVSELRFWAESYKSDNRIKMQTNRGRVIGRWNRRGYGGGYP